MTALYTVSIDGGLPVKLPMPTAGAGDFSPDGKDIVYSPLFRDFRTWKRYEGGWAQNLLIFNLKNYDTQDVAPEQGEPNGIPCGSATTIYFVSDRDGILNLYQFGSDSEDTTQITKHTKWDVRWASSDNEHQIVYELDGELRVYDIRTKTDRDISITVPPRWAGHAAVSLFGRGRILRTSS